MEIFTPLGAITLLLIIALISACLIFFDRLLRFRRATVDQSSFLHGVINLLDKGNIDEAISICDEAPGPVAAVAREAVTRRHENSSILHDAMSTIGQEEIDRLNRRISILLLMARIAPLVGLVGTLLGVRVTLVNIAKSAPVMTPIQFCSALSGTISVAAISLIVATICYVFHHILSEQLNRMSQDLTAGASVLFRYFINRHDSSTETI